MSVRISLVSTADDRTLQWGTAQDPDAAGRLALAYLSVGSCRTGRTKVVLRHQPDPDQPVCVGDGVIDQLVDGVWTTSGCSGCRNCQNGANR